MFVSEIARVLSRASDVTHTRQNSARFDAARISIGGRMILRKLRVEKDESPAPRDSLTGRFLAWFYFCNWPACCSEHLRFSSLT